MDLEDLETLGIVRQACKRAGATSSALQT